MSALSEHLRQYLQLRRLLGHELADAARLLPRFVAHLDANEIEFVTVEATVAWSLEPRPRSERLCGAGGSWSRVGSRATCRGSIRGPRSRPPG
jgi:hypothetical protein